MYSYFQEYHHREHEQILGAPLGGFYEFWETDCFLNSKYFYF